MCPTSELLCSSFSCGTSRGHSSCWHNSISNLGRCPKPKADMCLGIFLVLLPWLLCSLPPGVPISLFSLWRARQICVTWSKTLLPGWVHWVGRRKGRQTEPGNKLWNELKQNRRTSETSAVMVTRHLAMYLPQREGLKETASLSRLSRCLLWRMGCLPSSWTQSADAFQAAPKPW